MKTITIYSFDELSKEAQERAIEDYRDKHYDQEIFWSNEMLESLKALFKLCDGIKLKDYSLGDQRSSIDIEFNQDEAGELSGKRAFAWIENNLLCYCRIRFNDPKRAEYRKYGASYYAGQIKPCPFTGYCFDEDLLHSLLDDIKAGDTLKTAFEGLAQVYEKQLNNEIDYQNSDEYIKESLENNDYEFLANGQRI